MSGRRRGPGRPARLSQDDVVAAAERLVAAEGIDALSMRAVARRLATSPMALYRHVANKDELLGLLLDRVVADLPHPPLPPEPRERILAVCGALHDGFAARPWVVEALRRHLMGASALWPVEALVGALRDAGLDQAEAVAAYRALWQLTVGELTLVHASSAAREDTGAVDPEQFPTLAGLAPHWAQAEDGYRAAVAALVEGLLRQR